MGWLWNKNTEYRLMFYVFISLLHAIRYCIVRMLNRPNIRQIWSVMFLINSLWHASNYRLLHQCTSETRVACIGPPAARSFLQHQRMWECDQSRCVRKAVGCAELCTYKMAAGQRTKIFWNVCVCKHQSLSWNLLLSTAHSHITDAMMMTTMMMTRPC